MSGAVQGGADVAATDAPSTLEHFQNWFREEIEKREQLNRDLQAELGRYKLENADLQARLAERNASAQATHLDNSNEIDPDSVEDAPVSYATYSKLREQHEITWKSLKVTHQAMERYKAKYQKMKESIRPWQEYARRCHDRAQRPEIPAPSHDALPPMPWSSADTSRLSSSRPSSLEPGAIVKTSTTAHARSPSSVSLGNEAEHPSKLKSPSKLRKTRLADSSSSPEVIPKVETDEANYHEIDLPVLEDERQLQVADTTVVDELRSDQTVDTDEQSYHSPARQAGYLALSGGGANSVAARFGSKANSADLPVMEGTPLKPIHIKSEPDSSPTLQVIGYESEGKESIDLDETGAHITTPRKLRRLQTLLRQSSSLSGSSLQPMQHAYNSNSRIARTGKLQHGQFASLMPRERSGLDNDPMDDQALHALGPLDPNRTDLPRFRADPEHAMDKKRKLQLLEGIGSVTEDGDRSRSSFRPISSSKKIKADNTIQALLNERTPAKRMIITPASSTTKRNQKQPQMDVSTPTVHPRDKQRSNHLPTPTTSSRARQQKPVDDFNMPPPPVPKHNQSASVTKGRLSPRERAVPLRQRLISDLNPEDFKLNPRAHGNLDTTHIEPVRSREDRQHLHGCTDPSCPQCGVQMRALAAELPITMGSTLFASTQDEQMTDEERLLKHHLGDAFSLDEVQHMDPTRRAELVLQAKVQIVAARHGRHRLRPNARAKSPPGFWEMDMPTTQELEERAQEVEKRARETVRERYREALRRGGRWLFKDE